MSDVVKVWEVVMQDHFEYETYDQVPELVWAYHEARFRHVGNDIEPGVMEFMVMVYQGDDPDNIPEALRPIFREAQEHGCDWILFNQG